MPKKVKTKKSIVKRIKVTKGKKILLKRAGQGHFNAREGGKTTRNKRRTHTTSKANIKNIKKFVPYV